MKCPCCMSGNVYIVDSRFTPSNQFLRTRRYKCADCNGRFNTVEAVSSVDKPKEDKHER